MNEQPVVEHNYFLLDGKLCCTISSFEAIHVQYNTYTKDIEYSGIFYFKLSDLSFGLTHGSVVLLPNREEIILQYLKAYSPFVGSDLVGI